MSIKEQLYVIHCKTCFSNNIHKFFFTHITLHRPHPLPT
ncbi:hypothetical protein EUBVEN_01730 [Eubacterium ventriosum ATCC 27560]|uniref:Uncharacterized protein n=1 Tax=Eubacterium ventriosum ATCC 27560 TaxID=411463 RepID=A5Z7P2_9FIRM|nr:hypothetical protein EUBVEN_01730 [Eubacterium ventriosum ATCC 27560]